MSGPKNKESLPCPYWDVFMVIRLKKIKYDINVTNIRKNISMVLDTHRSILFFI
ncbi:hypothetical protein BMQ_pBM50025 (plasmid) [Priestia megaterium QM B1551]|uniref:Uncharacterized protein n=1 Tax=Priestia megaterium (strain ATCC 12872 / QMB1551) TaxID=545693 RepID=D5E3I9_PRIM1|nr:hypothetical protein BMQ_pBM50025 [Priestia megaterium QM B1551]